MLIIHSAEKQGKWLKKCAGAYNVVFCHLWGILKLHWPKNWNLSARIGDIYDWSLLHKQLKLCISEAISSEKCVVWLIWGVVGSNPGLDQIFFSFFSTFFPAYLMPYWIIKRNYKRYFFIISHIFLLRGKSKLKS